MTCVVIDFETASDCDLERAGAWRYAEDPTTEIFCACFQVDGGAVETWTPRGNSTRLLALARDPEVFFVAHGASFEKAIWRRQMVLDYGFPDIPNSRWHDTMATAAYRRVPLALEDVARALDLHFQKDMKGSRFTVGLSKARKDGSYDRSEEALNRVYSYCRRDVEVETSLFRKLGALPQGERNVWLLDQRINERGILLDKPFIAAARKVVAGAIGPLTEEFRSIVGFNPGQRDRVLDWVRANGVYLPDLRKETLASTLGKTDEGEIVDVADELCAGLPPNVRRALSIRQLVGSASIKKLERMQACVGADGRARGLLLYHGAGPGRWSGRLLQPHNFPRGSLLIDKEPPDPELVVSAIMTGDHEYVEAVLGPAVESVVSALRHAIIAMKKRALVVGDYAGIEARIVLALSGQHDKASLMASGKDVYLDMAEAIYKAPTGSMNKKSHSPQRTIGKNTVLGCGFMMGWRKFKARYCPEQTDEFAQQVVRSYREDWAPCVPKLWRALDFAAKETVWTGKSHDAFGCTYRMEDEWLTCQIPSGRKLWYFQPRPHRKAMPWSTPEEPDVRAAWRYQAPKNGRLVWVDAFGGLLTENVVQALARDLLVDAMFKCERNNLPIVLTVHDEIVAEAEERFADSLALQQIMCDIPAWARDIGIPVSAECWTGGRYKK